MIRAIDMYQSFVVITSMPVHRGQASQGHPTMGLAPCRPTRFMGLFIQVMKKHPWSLGIIMHQSMLFSPRRGREGVADYSRELDYFEKRGSPYPCDTILCPKSPGRAFRFKHNFFRDFFAEKSTVPPLCQSRLSNSGGQ